MKNIILFILISLISPLWSSGQTKYLSYDQINTHISNCLNKNFHRDSLETSKLCRRGFIFIKFNVSKHGIIEHLSFSKDSSATFITEPFTKAVNALSKDKALINTLKKLKTTIVLPVLYDYEAGCIIPDIDRTKATEVEKYKYVLSNLKLRAETEYCQKDFINMLNFQDGKISALSCILLSPCWVVAFENPGY